MHLILKSGDKHFGKEMDKVPFTLILPLKGAFWYEAQIGKLVIMRAITAEIAKEFIGHKNHFKVGRWMFWIDPFGTWWKR